MGMYKTSAPCRIFKALLQTHPHLVTEAWDRALEQAGGLRKHAAVLLGVSEPNFLAILREVGLEAKWPAPEPHVLNMDRKGLWDLLIEVEGDRAEAGRRLGVSSNVVERHIRDHNLTRECPPSTSPFWEYRRQGATYG